ncbi:DUF1552 domain-containing protein [Adhaeribacter aquaticus]|uniref:DUF1552 domain-containing protein n=1 Tax=Adhaeribacter aquaticus TaxID=299567 RepID=UPI000411006D|nr:DUF1552 domain-containing protein [Adhaeribacter aquaticus]
MSSNWHISRRRMLKGLGACIALPFLQAMVPPGMSMYNMPKKPVRFSFLYMPNGVNQDHWTPAQFGSKFELTKTLRPLAKVRQDITILNELMNKGSIFPGAEGHFCKTANIMTCRPILKTTGEDLNSGGISFDQLVAQQKGQSTLFDSLQYGMERINSGICGATGFTRLYAASVSWKSPNQPCTREIDPRMAFNRLFRSFVPSTKKRDETWKSSVLDLVQEDAKALQRKLGRSDQDKLEEYLESIRSLEMRIDNEEKIKAFERHVTPEIKKELVHLNLRIDEFKEQYVGVDITEKVRQMLDIQALAFQSDATRVSSFMFGNAASNRNFSFIPGVQGSHHQISHHQNNAGEMEQYRKINEFYVTQLAYYLEKLKSIPDGESNLLDNSVVMFTSGLRDGNSHSSKNIPVIVAGKAGGKLKTGQNLQFKPETPLSNLYLSLARVLDVRLSKFADSTGELSEIYA